MKHTCMSQQYSIMELCQTFFRTKNFYQDKKTSTIKINIHNVNLLIKTISDKGEIIIKHLSFSHVLITAFKCYNI